MPVLRLLAVPLLVLLAVVLPAAPASAIVGGKTTQRDWPHMAAMEYQDPDSGEWGLHCGGSLLRSDVILTAAHCFEDEDRRAIAPSRLRFMLGSKKLSAGGERIGLVRIVEHPRWDETDGEAGDVALVKLARPSTLGRPIRVGENADEPRWEPGDPSVVTGWGTEFFRSPTVPDDLKEAEVPIVSDAECQRSYEFTLGFDPATNVCAGNRTGGEDSCQGDSGGPLQVVDATGAWVLVGVVSYGLGCAFPTQYGVYAEAGGDTLRGWIRSNADAIASQPAPAGGSGSNGGTSGSTGATTNSSSATALAPLRTRLLLPARLRVVRRGRRASVTLRTTAPLRSIRVSLRRGKRVLASGRRASLRSARGRVIIRPRVRRGLLRFRRATLRVSAVDMFGRRIVVQRIVRLRR